MKENKPVPIKKTDNHGNPRSDYFDRIATMDDICLSRETEDMIWLSAYGNDNPRSDYHWKVDACYDECKKRDPIGHIYNRAWKAVSEAQRR